MTDAKDKNEDLFREVNERIEAISPAVPVDEATMEFLCECDDAGCQDKIKATRAEYEAVRAKSTHFIVLANHVDPSVEHVIASNERFLVVEKEGVAARRAEESDPREQA
jgi:hypothetical protein